jgi:hypothetical protein
VAETNAIEKSSPEAKEDLFHDVLQHSIEIPSKDSAGKYPFVRHRLFPSKEFDPQVHRCTQGEREGDKTKIFKKLVNKNVITAKIGQPPPPWQFSPETIDPLPRDFGKNFELSPLDFQLICIYAQVV